MIIEVATFGATSADFAMAPVTKKGSAATYTQFKATTKEQTHARQIHKRLERMNRRYEFQQACMRTLRPRKTIRLKHHTVDTQFDQI